MAFENVHNYHEELVFTEIQRALSELGREVDNDFADDVACVSLNNLPPRYIHHNVYLAFYQSTADRRQLEQEIKQVVSDAIAFVTEHRR